MRYIDADKAIAMFKEAQKKTNNIVEITSLIGSMAIIDSCKTEDVAPIIHAKWIVTNCIQDYVEIGCSSCQVKWRNRRHMQYPNYCPYCGAKMNNSIKINYHVNFKNCDTKMDEETKDV